MRLAVDDFGTGLLLARLSPEVPDRRAQDRPLLRVGHRRLSEAAALVHTLVQLGKVLNLETIAEGIEDDEQRLRLQAEQVDTGQGFLFARPLDAKAVDRFLEDFVPITKRSSPKTALAPDALPA